MVLRKRLGLGLAIASLLVAAAGPVSAADSGTVDAQVTVATPCIELVNPASGSLDFGTLPFSSGNDVSFGQQSFSYKNCGDASEHIWGQATDADGTTAHWDLNDYATGAPCDQAANQYKLQVSGGAVFANLTHIAQDLEAVASNLTNGHTLYLDMPCAGSDGAGETMTFHATFTATF